MNCVDVTSDPATDLSTTSLCSNDSDITIGGEPLLLVAAGAYLARCVNVRRLNKHYGGKVGVDFMLAEGKHFGSILTRFYGAQGGLRQGAARNSIHLGNKTDLVRDYVRYMGPPARPDRLPVNNMIGRYFSVRVGDVASDSKGKAIPESLRYSVVKELIDIMPTDFTI